MGRYDTQCPMVCKLSDGKTLEYDACSESRDAYEPNKFKYIGKGCIWSIDGVLQNDDQTYHFFVKTF